MQKMKHSLILSVLGFGFILSGCAKSPDIPDAVIPPVKVVTVEVDKPAPIVPSVDRLDLRNVEWVIVTADNKDEIIKEGVALFALTAEGYENISLNIADIRALIQQQQKIIAIYKSSYE